MFEEKLSTWQKEITFAPVHHTYTHMAVGNAFSDDKQLK